MTEPLLEVVGWFVPPLLGVSIAAWVHMARRAGEHDVRLGRLEVQMSTLDGTMKQVGTRQHEVDIHVLEILQRLSRMEETLKHIHHYLNGKGDESRNTKGGS